MKDYLGKERTPAEVSQDVARIIRVYRQRWHRDKIVIVGFSRGANLAPFAVARFSDEMRADVTLLALIGLAPTANFKWHWQDVIRDVKRSSDVPVRPELDHIRMVRTICLFGADEKESGCRDTPPEVKRVERTGGHHMDGDYKAVADIVFDAIPH
jgi:type IV secretory pathway VirJ component